jgi:hypothetical protein
VSGLSLTAQLCQLQRTYPAGRGRLLREQLFWEQRIRPRPLSHEYLCRVEYRRDEYPAVYCLDPPLSALANGRRLPHVRSREEPIRLCLFFHEPKCWNDGMLLAKVVIPLTLYWLEFFEEWLFTGEWRGGGTHDITPCPPTSLPVFPGEESFSPNRPPNWLSSVFSGEILRNCKCEERLLASLRLKAELSKPRRVVPSINRSDSC